MTGKARRSHPVTTYAMIYVSREATRQDIEYVIGTVLETRLIGTRIMWTVSHLNVCFSKINKIILEYTM